MKLSHGHASLQFSDNLEQKKHDVKLIFGRGYDILTGTESGERPLTTLVVEGAHAEGYKIRRWRGNWVAVKREIIVPRSWKTGDVWVAHRDETYGRGHDSGFPWAKFEHKQLGVIAVAAVHFPTKGQRPDSPNYDINTRYARKLGEWGKRHAKGKAIAFVQGDVNIPDRLYDVFRGDPFTTCWDELGKHPNTGHGNIDIIASYDADGRVKAQRARAFNDQELHLHSDHFLIEADYEVKPRA